MCEAYDEKYIFFNENEKRWNNSRFYKKILYNKVVEAIKELEYGTTQGIKPLV